MRATELHLHHRQDPHHHRAATRWTGGLAALVVALLVAVGSPAAVPVAAAEPTRAPAVVAAVAAPSTPVADEQVFVADANAARARVGLPPLGIDAQLTAAACRWSTGMAAAGAISHDHDLAAGAGQPWSTLGENVGVGPAAGPVSAALLASPGHYANIVNGDFTRIGVGVVWTHDAYGRDLLWVTERFLGWTPTVTPAPAPAPAPPSTPAASAPAPAVAPAPAPTTTAPTTTAAPSAPTTTATPDPAGAVAADRSADLGAVPAAAEPAAAWTWAPRLAVVPAPPAVTGSASLGVAPAAAAWGDGSFAASIAGSWTGLVLLASLLLVGWALAVWPRPVDPDDVPSLPEGPAPSR